MKKVCKKHGEVEYHRFKDLAYKSGYRYRCGRCNGEAVVRRKQKIKQTLVEEAGGACVLCGYNTYVGALQFHHLDPTQKSFCVSSGQGKSLSAFRAEAKKCVLLCANCHAEVQASVTQLGRVTAF